MCKSNGPLPRRTLVMCFVVLILADAAHSGILRDSGSALPGVSAGWSAWGDYNGDGFPDLALIGEQRVSSESRKICHIYQNNTGVLTLIQQLSGVNYGHVSWADYDNDGDLDLLVVGLDDDDANSITLYENDNGSFTEDTFQDELVPVRYASADWADYNKDGFVDVAVAGMDNLGQAVTVVYANTQIGLRHKLQQDPLQSLLNVNKGAVSWGDYDSDGDPDLIVSGFNSQGFRAAKLFKNNPLGLLREDESNSAVIKKHSNAAIAWGDIDSDGDLDVLQSGWADGWIPETILFVNSLGGRLEAGAAMNIPSTIELVGVGAFGDYDNDGLTDVVFSGIDRFSTVSSYVLSNVSNTSLQIDAAQVELEGLRNGHVSWSDVDQDGDLDLLVIGQNAAGERQSVLYTNDESTANTAPAPPATLKAPFVTNSSVVFSWSAASDATTAQEALTYAVRVGNTSGGSEFLSAEIPVGRGNAGSRLELKLHRSLREDQYYWSVQSIDNQYKQSAFSTESSFSVRRFVNSELSVLDVQQASQAWGDYNDDGYIDLVIAGQDINGNNRTILYDNIRGVLTENTENLLQPFKNGDIAWGDIDNDGDLDLCLAGETVRSNKTAVIYRNEPAGVLTADLDASGSLSPMSDASLALGDVDNDGDLDLFMAGVDRNGNITTILYWNSQGNFTVDNSQSFVGFANGDVLLLDLENDGDLDVLLTGEVDFNTQTEYGSRLYLNDGTGKFLEAGILPEFVASTFGYGDYDNDGDFDVVLTGEQYNAGTGNYEHSIILYSSTAAGLIQNTTITANLIPVRKGRAVFGDYDNDGDADLIIAGNDDQNFPVLQAFENNNNSFTADNYSVFTGNGVDFSTIALVDIDNDGDLDLMTAGRSEANFVSSSAVYDNLEGIDNPNYVPQPPSNLASSVNGSSVTLSWDMAMDPEGNGTVDKGLTYEVRVGTAPGSGDIRTGVVSPGYGNVGFARTLMLRNLASNLYYWSARSVDNGFAVSDWSVDQQFIIDTVKPEVDTVTVSPSPVGIAKATFVVNFDENFGMDLTRSPQVTFSPGDTEILVEVNQISYDGLTWIGEADIRENYVSGAAKISVKGAYDQQGNKMDDAQMQWEFEIDTDRPTIIRTTPAPNQIGVTRSIIVSAKFSEPVRSSSLTSETVKLFQGSTPITGNVTVIGNDSLSFSPGAVLQGNTEYEFRIISTVQDAVGNGMNGDYIWRFRTAQTVTASTGGEIRNEDGSVRIYIAPRALVNDEEVPIEFLPLTVAPPAGLTYTNIAFRIGPAQGTVALDKPATLTLKYDDSALPAGIQEENLAVFRYTVNSPGQFDFTTRLGGTVDPDSNSVSVPVNSLGMYGLFEDARDVEEAIGINNVEFVPRAFSPAGNGELPAETGISFTIGKPMKITIEVYNTSGRFVARIIDEQELNAGGQIITWDGKDGDGRVVPSGLYIVRIKGEGTEKIKTVGVINN